MNRWSPDFPGRLVDFPDYCRLYERVQERRPGTVFAYEPMWVNADGRIYGSDTLVVAAWLETPGHGSFEVLENALRHPTLGLVGLRTEAQLRTIHNAGHLMNEAALRQARENDWSIQRGKAERRAARRDLGQYVLKKAPGSRVGRRMVREST